MFFHRFKTQAAFIGNLLIAAPVAHQTRQIMFSTREPRQIRFGQALPPFVPIQVTIQTHRPTLWFLTGIALVFSSRLDSSCAVEAMKVPAPHNVKHRKTIAIFVIKFTD
jgi:hypothetical protein